MSDLTLLLDEDPDDPQDHYTTSENRLYDEAFGPRSMTRHRQPGEWSDAP